eukprot:TRINITY_DN19677_c0_g1_i2.p1 TRINITY_DN19677_c0_g1~~TRINITY_DN19677_c0_g1_i2.p1  ORF type:complete len:331 (-),score=45.77 TRINITY_DN19677_c0_g1_i2:51-1043(-)
MILHQCVNNCFRSCHRLCIHFKQFAPRQQHLLLVARWLRASLMLFFIELRHGEMSEARWPLMVSAGFLKSDEAFVLQRYNSAQRGFLLLDWIAHAVVDGHARSEQKAKGSVKGLLDRLTMFDEAQKCVLDHTRMPVAFQYYHIMNLTVFLTVSMWSYAMAKTESIWGPILFTLAAFMVIGMLELAKMFSDPFGDGDVDFDVHLWLERFFENQTAYVEQYDFNQVFSCGLEQKLSMESAMHYKPGFIAQFIGTRGAPLILPEVHSRQALQMTDHKLAKGTQSSACFVDNNSPNRVQHGRCADLSTLLNPPSAQGYTRIPSQANEEDDDDDA